MKNARQEKILELVEKYEIDTQDALIRRLADAGINATQTTVSRDIKQLKLVKGTTSRGTYKYILPQMRRESGVPVLNSAITDAVTNIEAAENIVVIKTYSGMANAVAVCVDSCGYNEIIGSVAGDDTILLVIKTAAAAKETEKKLRDTFRFG